jgi:hypothetical protein
MRGVCLLRDDSERLRRDISHALKVRVGKLQEPTDHGG